MTIQWFGEFPHATWAERFAKDLQEAIYVRIAT